MNKRVAFLLCNLIFLRGGWAESFLKATSYPENFNDLSFVERIDVLQSGYEPYESEYNEKGICIKNCAYRGITIDETVSKYKIDTENAIKDTQQWENYNFSDVVEQYRSDAYTDADRNFLYEYYDDYITHQGIGAKCLSHRTDIDFFESVPKKEPLLNQPCITRPFGQDIHPVTGKPSTHDAVDYRASIGTPVFAPAYGQVIESRYSDSSNCGHMVKLKHIDGKQTVYCHLDQIFVNPGDTVLGGCMFATSGNSGRGTAPHLHYGILNKENRPINPTQIIGRSVFCDKI